MVECRGIHADGVEVVADEAAGWRVVSFERGPDDDVDAVFTEARRSHRASRSSATGGEPTVAEMERNELPED